MHIEERIFNRKKVDFPCLLKIGFSKSSDGYTFSEFFGEGKYCAAVFVSRAGNVSGKVLELESGDEFLPLRVEQLKVKQWYIQEEAFQTAFCRHVQAFPIHYPDSPYR